MLARYRDARLRVIAELPRHIKILAQMRYYLRRAVSCWRFSTRSQPTSNKIARCPSSLMKAAGHSILVFSDINIDIDARTIQARKAVIAA